MRCGMSPRSKCSKCPYRARISGHGRRLRAAVVAIARPACCRPAAANTPVENLTSRVSSAVCFVSHSGSRNSTCEPHVTCASMRGVCSRPSPVVVSGSAGGTVTACASRGSCTSPEPSPRTATHFNRASSLRRVCHIPSRR